MIELPLEAGRTTIWGVMMDGVDGFPHPRLIDVDTMGRKDMVDGVVNETLSIERVATGCRRLHHKLDKVRTRQRAA